MVAFPKDHPLAARRLSSLGQTSRASDFLMSRRDPGRKFKTCSINKTDVVPATVPRSRSWSTPIRETCASASVDGNRGISLTCEAPATGEHHRRASSSREVRDGDGPTRVGYVAYWRRNNDNPALKQFLSLLQAHPAVPSTSIAAVGLKPNRHSPVLFRSATTTAF